MGILIKNGMEIPRACSACIFLDAEHWKCRVCGNASHSADCRPTDCPLSEVPTPHGRLIDADALIADLKRQCREVFRVDAVSPDDFWITRIKAYNERLWRTWCESFFDYLQTRPIIIPASEAEAWVR